MGRHPPRGFTPCSWYSLAISSRWRWGLSLNWARTLSMCGFRSCIARMLLTCFTVSGKRRLRTITVSITIESHQATPSVWWKYSSTVPWMSTMGPKRVWKKSAMLLIMRFYSSYGVESSLGERVTTEHPEDAHVNALRYAVLLYGLQRVQRAARGKSAG